jgi:hypothetical protein
MGFFAESGMIWANALAEQCHNLYALASRDVHLRRSCADVQKKERLVREECV